MARNKVQFQKGLSLGEFQRLYGGEDQCHDALVAWRWPDGFVCPGCGSVRHGWSPARVHFQCADCRLQTSAKAGTIFHKSKTPLTKWFLAMHLITSAKNDIASLELARQLDVKWDTAWLMKQKLMEVMRQRNSIYRLEGAVQIDDAYLGGEKAGKTGVVSETRLRHDERPTRSLSSSPSRPVTASRPTRRCAALRGSTRRRSATMRRPTSYPERSSSATGSAVSRGSARPACCTCRWSPAAAGQRRF